MVASKKPFFSSSDAGAREEAVHVLAVVEHERSVDGAHGRVKVAQRRCSLDVHVDVAGHDRGDPIGVGTELAPTEDVDGQPDAGGLGCVLDDLGAAGRLWLRVRVAVGEPEGDRRLRGRGGAALADATDRRRRGRRGAGRWDWLPPLLLHAASSRVAAIATGSFQDRVVMISPISECGAGRQLRDRCFGAGHHMRAMAAISRPAACLPSSYCSSGAHRAQRSAYDDPPHRMADRSAASMRRSVLLDASLYYGTAATGQGPSARRGDEATSAAGGAA